MLPEVNKAVVFDAAAHLIETFNWEDTPQGSAYWQQVHEHLVALSDAAADVETGLEYDDGELVEDEA